MEEKKSNTYKLKRESHQVSQQAKDNLKIYSAMKKKIMEAFGDEELTIPQLAEKTGLSRNETLYYAMSLLKFGILENVRLDDMDEFYLYKIRK